MIIYMFIRYIYSRRRWHTRWPRDWSSDVCSSDLLCLLVNRTSDIFSLVHASSERTAFNRRFHKPGHPILTVQTSSENDMPRWGVLQQTSMRASKVSEH